MPFGRYAGGLFTTPPTVIDYMNQSDDRAINQTMGIAQVMGQIQNAQLRKQQQEMAQVELAQKQRQWQKQQALEDYLRGGGEISMDALIRQGAPDLGLNVGQMEQAKALKEATLAQGSALQQERLQAAQAMHQDRLQAQAERQRELIEAREAMARLAASLRPGPQPRQPGAPVAVIGPDGNPMLVPPEQAYGKQPYSPRTATEKPLPPTVVKDLADKSSVVEATARFVDNFRPQYSGLVSGNAKRIAGSYLPESVVGPEATDTATFWNDYQSHKNMVRHELFGAALTATEKSEWEKADINPGMDPGQIKRNLGRRLTIEKRAYQKLENAYRAPSRGEQLEALKPGADTGGTTAPAPSARRKRFNPATGKIEEY